MTKGAPFVLFVGYFLGMTSYQFCGDYFINHESWIPSLKFQFNDAYFPLFWLFNWDPYNGLKNKK